MGLINRDKIAAIFAVGVMATLYAAAPARAEDQTAFGQPLPQQYLLNKMLSPKNTGQVPGPSQPSGGAQGQVPGANRQASAGSNGQAPAGSGGQVSSGAPADADDDDYGQFPRRYLLNRLFDPGK